MTPSEQERTEIARKSEAAWLAKFSERDANNDVAAALDLSPSTISKFKGAEQALNLAAVCHMLAYLGLKVVPVEHVTVDPHVHRALVTLSELGIEQVKEGRA